MSEVICCIWSRMFTSNYSNDVKSDNVWAIYWYPRSCGLDWSLIQIPSPFCPRRRQGQIKMEPIPRRDRDHQKVVLRQVSRPTLISSTIALLHSAWSPPCPNSFSISLCNWSALIIYKICYIVIKSNNHVPTKCIYTCYYYWSCDHIFIIFFKCWHLSMWKLQPV